MQKGYGKLFLIPNFLAKENPDQFLAEYVRERVHELSHFIVETEKDARALIKRLRIAAPQSELRIMMWNEHSTKSDAEKVLGLLEDGADAGIISDAGLPCIADPGSEVVALAHRKNIQVIPLPGASSILMTLMGSGLSGQNFAFNGYLPVDRQARIKRIKELEKDARTKGQSQVFMETPYRNNHLLEDVLKNCAPQTKLCIGSDMSGENQFLKMMTIQEWRKQVPDLHKVPTIFVLG